MKLDSYRIKNISELVAALELTPRQIQEVFRMLGHLFSTTEENRGRLLWCLAVGTIFMASLKIGDNRMFQLLGHQEAEPKEVFDFLIDLLGGDNVDWWFKLLVTGGALRINEDEKVEEILKRVGLLKDDENFNSSRDLGQFYQGWGHSYSSRFVQIREKIEQIAQWN